MKAYKVTEMVNDNPNNDTGWKFLSYGSEYYSAESLKKFINNRNLLYCGDYPDLRPDYVFEFDEIRCGVYRCEFEGKGIYELGGIKEENIPQYSFYGIKEIEIK